MSKNARSIAMGTVISDAFSLFFKTFSATFLVAIGIGVIKFFQWETQFTTHTIFIIFTIFACMITPLFYGTIYYQTFRVMENTPISAVEAFRATRKRYWIILFGLILAGIMLCVGFFLLVIPGLFLFSCLSVFLPVLLLEGYGVGGSIKKSITLVWGNWWKVFWLGLFSLALASLVNVPPIALEFLFPLAPYGSLLGILSACIVLPWMAAFGMTLWHHLKLANQPDGV